MLKIENFVLKEIRVKKKYNFVLKKFHVKKWKILC